MGVDLLLAEPRAGCGLAGGVTDHRREVADDQDRDVPAVLEEPEPPEDDRETEMNVRGGGVDAELDSQRLAPTELDRELGGRDHVDRVGGEQRHLGFDVHGGDGNKTWRARSVQLRSICGPASLAGRQPNFALSPPSTVTIAPFTNDDAGNARFNTMCATSSGSP